jgi:hypothetical protein
MPDHCWTLTHAGTKYDGTVVAVGWGIGGQYDATKWCLT